MRLSLRSIEECLSGHSPRIDYAVTGLEVASAAIVLAPLISKASDRSLAEETITVFEDTIHRLEGGDLAVNPKLNDTVLTAIRRLYAPLNRTASRVDVAGMSISTAFTATIDRLTGVKYVSTGYVKGVLETIDLHGKTNFVIYPPIGNHEVKCNFPEELFDKVLQHMRHTVTVYGEQHFKKDGPYPSLVEVESIDSGDDAEAPTLCDLRGVLKAEGDSVLQVRAVRDEW